MLFSIYIYSLIKFNNIYNIKYILIKIQIYFKKPYYYFFFFFFPLKSFLNKLIFYNYKIKK